MSTPITYMIYCIRKCTRIKQHVKDLLQSKEYTSLYQLPYEDIKTLYHEVVVSPTV